MPSAACHQALVGGLVLAAAAVSAPVVSLARTAADPDAPLMLRARVAQAGLPLDVQYVNRSTLAARRLPVTDVVVRLHAAERARLGAALNLPDGDRPGRDRALFLADVTVVAGGRAYIEERARCAPWRSGASICRLECEGGAFAILRQLGPQGPVLTLRIGRIEAADEVGLRFGACTEGGADPTLEPRQGQDYSEVPLGPDAP